MSDRRPESKLIVPCESCQEYDDIPCGHIATPSELVDELRRGVESGTIKGEVVWLGVVDSGPSIHKAVFWDRESAEWNEPEGPYLLIGPVSDGGSET